MKTQPYGSGISVYPEFDNPALMERIRDYISSAADAGFHEVFSSLHLPELNYSGNLAQMKELGEFIQSQGLEFSLDISGSTLRRLLSEPSVREQLCAIPLTYLRLDYGFTPEQCVDVVKNLHLPGVMLNASVLSRQEVSDTVSVLKKAFPNLKIRGHHNFYPRQETGLSMDFTRQSSTPFHNLGIPVTACIASQTEPRLPLRAGLPTVEKHRYLSCEKAARELLGTGLIDSILIGDSFATMEDLQMLTECCNCSPVALRVSLEEGISQTEKEILLGGIHHARPDQAEYVIRSQSSRQMAVPGTEVSPRTSKMRNRGAVTIDNSNYLRYSGELQVVLSPLPEDTRVNLVGHIHSDDLWKLDYIVPGSNFYFISE